MKQYVIIKCGQRFSLKEKINNGFFGAGLFISKDLNKVKVFAAQNNLNVVAVGDIYEV